MDGFIREVRPDDAPAIAHIYNRYVLETTVSFEFEPLSVEEMRQRIEDIASTHPYFVYESDGNVCGYCCAHQWRERKGYRHTMETTLYVADGYHHKGIGSLLLARLIEACRAKGYRALIACITGENETSIAIHSKFGFKQVSLFRQVGRKFGRWLDVVDMELLLQE